MVLVLDSLKMCRDLLAERLAAAGHEVRVAGTAAEALAMIEARRPELLILDIRLPTPADGMQVIYALRTSAASSGIPILILTEETERNYVLQALRLGVREYVLKTNFSLKDLLARMERLMARAHEKQPATVAEHGAAAAALVKLVQSSKPPADAPRAPPTPAPVEPTPAPAEAAACTSPNERPTASPAVFAAPLKPLATRDEIVARAEQALDGRTLPGMLAEVIAMAASPRTSTVDLAGVIARDPMLAANVLRMANSAAYATARSAVTSIPEAIKKIGCATVGRIAAAIAVIDAMPDNLTSGFNPVRAWQHSFAVAQLCQQLAPQDNEAGGVPYLVGLCHDLAEILFHAHFGAEANKVQEMQQHTGRPRAQVERELLGITREELVPVVLARLSLPESIRRTIVAYHHALPTGMSPADPTAALLWLAEMYANGILLASSATSVVCPLHKTLCKRAHGQPNPAAPDAATLRAEVFCLTTLMAQLSSRDSADLAAPIFPRRDVSVWLVRDDVFSTLDPLEAALGSLARVQVSNRFPTTSEAEEVEGLVVAAASAAKAGDALAMAGRSGTPSLVLATGSPQSNPAGALSLPIALSDLRRFVQSLKPAKAAAA